MRGEGHGREPDAGGEAVELFRKGVPVYALVVLFSEVLLAAAPACILGKKVMASRD